MTCQACPTRTLTRLADLGTVPLCNVLREDAPRYPLVVYRCPSCGLVQLGSESIVPQSEAFPPSYPYRSRFSGQLKRNFDNLAATLRSVCNSRDVSIVDVGCNDGTFLDAAKRHGFTRTVGIDPTDAIDDATGHETHKARLGDCNPGTFDVVVCSNAFAHVTPLNEFVESLQSLVDRKKRSFLCIEVHKGEAMLNGQWDVIYHEHVRYFTVDVLIATLVRHAFDPFLIQETDVHGGSWRIIADTFGNGEYEWPSLPPINGGAELQQGINRSVANLRSFMSQVGPVWIAGCPSRLGTLASVAGFTRRHVVGVAEQTGSPKIGGTLPGTDIPIVDEREMLKANPSHVLLGSHHLGLPMAQAIRRRGFTGKFIAPLPNLCEIVA